MAKVSTYVCFFWGIWRGQSLYSFISKMGSKIRRKKKITQEKKGNKKQTANQPSYNRLWIHWSNKAATLAFARRDVRVNSSMNTLLQTLILWCLPLKMILFLAPQIGQHMRITALKKSLWRCVFILRITSGKEHWSGRFSPSKLQHSLAKVQMRNRWFQLSSTPW